jgi:hypothetical protein
VWLAVLLGRSPPARERRCAGLYFVLFYFWCAVSTMGKGPAGLAIPGAVALLHYVATGAGRELLRIRSGLGMLVFLVVGMPWYVAIYGRLGDEFIQRFVVHDIINRTVLGVHGDTGSIRYFLWQLGYAMFPWSGLVPVALLGWRFVVPADATDAQRDVARIGSMWFALAFTLFSAMITKFHHYIFPAIPGAAIDGGPRPATRAMGPADRPRPFLDARADRSSCAAALVLSRGRRLAARMGSDLGPRPPRRRAARQRPPRRAMLAAAAGRVGLGMRLHRRVVGSAAPDEASGYRDGVRRWARTPGTRDRLGPRAPSRWAALRHRLHHARPRDRAVGAVPGSERLIHLFVYNYDRPWPTRYARLPRGPLRLRGRRRR